MADGSPHSGAEAREASALERLILFTDAVVAIVITLMVLEVKPPSVHGEAELLKALAGMWHEYLAVGVSFLVIGNFWMRHHAHFQWVRRIDIGMIWLNLLFLLSICAIPFVTAVLAHHSGRVGTIVYAATVATASLLLTALWAYSSRPAFAEPDMPAAEGKVAVIGGLAIAAVFLASIPIAVWDADAAKWSWLAVLAVVAARRFAVRA